MTRPASFNRVWAEDAASDQMGGESTTADQGVIEQGWVGSATAEPPSARMQNYWQIRSDLALQEIERQGFLSWRNDVAYKLGAIVYYAGYLFQALSDNTGITPQGASDNGIWSFIQPGKWPTTTDNISGILPINKGGTGASDAATARANLGLLALAIKNTISNDDWSGTNLSILNGGTGASTAAAARSNLGLGTAAVAKVTTSSTDTTAGALLGVGDFGVGATSVPVVTDFNALPGGGMFRGGGSTLNKPPNTNAASVLNVPYSATYWGQIAFGLTGTGAGQVFVRTQLNGTFSSWGTVQNVTTALTALAALTPAANTFPYFNGTTTAASGAITNFALSLLDDADNTAARATLGLGSAATYTAGNAAGNLAPQGWDFIADTGAANAYVGTYSPAIPSLVEGMVIKLKAANANTGASTFNPNGLGAKAIVSIAHSALSGGEIVANGDVWLQYNASIGSGSWVLIAASGGNAMSGRLINIQVFTANGTWVPKVGTKAFKIRLIAGGGAGGGAVATTSAQIALGTGGCSGSYAEGYFTAVPSSAAVVVGAGGVATSGDAGGSGGSSSVGSLLSVTGGTGGAQFGPTTPPLTANVNPVGTSITGANIVGVLSAPPPIAFVTSLSVGYSGQGANSSLGAGGASSNNSSNGNPATGYGAGGGGALALASSVVRTGGNGAPGIVIIEEYS